MATTTNSGNNYAQLTTQLHSDRAAINLALGSLLTWFQSTMTDFSKAAPTESKPQPQLPDKIVDRLKTRIEIEFLQTPLQEAFAYISEETKVRIEIDGDALKDAGMTKNMAQNHKLGTVPAIEAIRAIINQYKKEGMVIVVDETNKLVTVMTRKFADNKGWQPFPLNP